MKAETSYFHWYPVPGSLTSGVSMLETGTGCPENLWSLPSWRSSKVISTLSWPTCSGCPYLCRRVGPDGLQMSFSTSTILWFCDKWYYEMMKGYIRLKNIIWIMKSFELCYGILVSLILRFFSQKGYFLSLNRFEKKPVQICSKEKHILKHCECTYRFSPRDICIKLSTFFQLSNRHKAGDILMEYIKLDCYIWKGITVQLMLHLRLFCKIC